MGRIIVNLLVISMFFCEVTSCWAQNGGVGNENRNSENIASNANSEEYVVDYYLVEERVNCRFGSSVTRYKVSNINLISTATMGQNNTRKVTTVYKKVKPKVNQLQGLMPSNLVAQSNEITASITALPVVEAPKVEVVEKTEKKDYIYVDLVKTYEGVLEKGYFSVDMLKKVADSRFFKDDLNKAAQWYSKLFEMTTDLEPIYYYRFAQSLRSVSQFEKAKEMMVAYEQKSISNSIR